MTNKKPRVAIVENDFGILKAVERLLHAYGYESEIFESAELFLQRSNEKAVDCLVLDINLDGMSGIELQKKLVGQGFAPPIIFITGRGDEPTIAQAIDMGCVAFLHKPFESRSLQSALHIALQLNGQPPTDNRTPA
ncbi:MAG: response regulator transcription factor [Burkholderiaceae bacterium]